MNNQLFNVKLKKILNDIYKYVLGFSSLRGFAIPFIGDRL
jgi:hypothetical protein